MSVSFQPPLYTQQEIERDYRPKCQGNICSLVNKWSFGVSQLLHICKAKSQQVKTFFQKSGKEWLIYSTTYMFCNNGTSWIFYTKYCSLVSFQYARHHCIVVCSKYDVWIKAKQMPTQCVEMSTNHHVYCTSANNTDTE